MFPPSLFVVSYVVAGSICRHRKVLASRPASPGMGPLPVERAGIRKRPARVLHPEL